MQGGIAYESLYEEMGGTYTLGVDGMCYPDLALPEEEPHYGKYGRMRLRHQKEHRKVLYNTLLLDGELVKHLNEVAWEKMNRIRQERALKTQ